MFEIKKSSYLGISQFKDNIRNVIGSPLEALVPKVCKNHIVFVLSYMLQLPIVNTSNNSDESDSDDDPMDTTNFNFTGMTKILC